MSAKKRGSKRPRTGCPHCGRDVGTYKRGRVARHYLPDGDICPGFYMPPLALTVADDDDEGREE